MITTNNTQHTATQTETSRACLYGDGLFETIAFRQGQVQFWQDHWQRLQEVKDEIVWEDVIESI
jgi:branched-subunit amino acid aminotransferase/4-amino-4-deoxychorismate lyase